MGTEPELLHQSAVVFHELNIKKNYSFGEDILASFTFNNYQASKEDFIGVFDNKAEDTCHEPFVSKKISSLPDDLPTTIALKIDFVLDGGAFELRYIGNDNQVLGKSAPFSISESIEVQESLIEVHEGMWSDASLVLIDKIDPKCDIGESAKPSESVDEIIKELVPNPNEVQLSESDSSIESGNVPEKTVSSKLESEKRRRSIAENALKVLMQSLKQQMGFIDRQTQELNEMTVKFGRHAMINTDLREENLAIQDENVTLHEGMYEMKEEYHDYQMDYCKIKRQMRQDNELIHHLKIQILEDRQEHQDEMTELRDHSIEQIELLERNTIRLELALNKERAEFKKTLLDKKQSQTEVTDSTTQKGIDVSDSSTQKQIDVSDSSTQKQIDVSDSSTQKQIDVTDSGTQKPIKVSDSTTQTQLNEYTSKIEKLEKKLLEQAKTHEEIIDRLEKELKKGNESKTTLSREYERTIRELESRVVNESTNASQKQSDLAVAENRFKEASNDIQFFRQKFIETEQKLQVNQMQLSRAMEELNIVQRQAASSSHSRSGEGTDGGMSCVSDIDDNRPLNCDYSCVSASTSAENMTVDRRRRAGGETTDCTDDESSWYHQSAGRSQSQESLPSSYGNNNNPSDYQYFPAGLIPIKKTTDPESNEQQIQVVDTRRPARRQRRKYGKPIDLTPSSSLTTVAIPDRGMVNQQPFTTTRPNFNKNVAEVDRVTLEKQYSAIRQHRNSLIRENTFLKNKIHGLKQDLLFTQKNMQNFSLEAEHKIAMLLMALNNQEYVSTQDLNAILQMFPVPNNQQVIYPQTCLQQPPIPHNEPSTTPPNHKLPQNKNGYLSPYAPEYRPNATNNVVNYQNFAPGSPLFIQNDPTMQQPHVEYNQPMAQQQPVEDANGSYIMQIPSQFPETPLPQQPVDASNQLAAIGVPISKTL